MSGLLSQKLSADNEANFHINEFLDKQVTCFGILTHTNDLHLVKETVWYGINTV